MRAMAMLRFGNVTLDGADTLGVAGFWSAALGRPVARPKWPG